MAKNGTLVRARPRQPRNVEAQTQSGSFEALYSLLGIAQPTASLPVNERTTYGLVGAWAAVNKISSAVSQMMVGAQAFQPDGRTEILPVPTVLENPCTNYTSSFTYWKELVSTALMRGNWVGLKCDYAFDGYPMQVLPMPIDSVNAYYDEDGFVIYEIGGEHFTPDELVHVRMGITMPGEIMAIGVVEAQRRNISGMLDQSQMAGSVWKGGGVPSGVVTIDVDLPSQQQVSTVKASWIGKVGDRSVAVIGRRMSYQPVSWSADDAQFLESRQFSIAECALMFGLRPEDLGSSFGASSSMTYGNRTDDALQRIIDTYGPCMLPVEQEWSHLIPGRNFVRGNPEALLRSSTRERYELHALAQSIGLETEDESREIEGKPPKPKEAKPEPPPQLQLPVGTPLSPTDTQLSEATPELEAAS
jgi:HK97 family phage portal protein